MIHRCLRCELAFETPLTQPRRCGNCGSPLWNKPRKRAKGAGRPAGDLEKRKRKATPNPTPVAAEEVQDREEGCGIFGGIELPDPVKVMIAEVARDIEEVTGFSGVFPEPVIPDPPKPARIVSRKRVKPERTTTDSDRQTLVKDPEVW